MIDVCYAGIKKISEDDDELNEAFEATEWTSSMAAVSLLENMAPICKNDIV
jgi:hypothetical protein